MSELDASDSDRETLERRARALARPIDPRRAEDVLDLFAFSLGRETYAIQSRCVLAVFPLAELSLLPGAVPPLVGITAWRGELLTILDLRGSLGLSATALDDLRHVVVLGSGRMSFGILADSALGPIEVPRSALRPTLSAPADTPDFLVGITDEAMLILDGDELFELVGATSSTES